MGEDGKQYANGLVSIRHPYSRAENTIEISIYSDTEKCVFIDEKTKSAIQQNPGENNLYCNDLYLKVPASAWQAESDGRFAATVEETYQGEDEDVQEMTFKIHIDIKKDKAWSYTF
jgi:hypothetical protein